METAVIREQSAGEISEWCPKKMLLLDSSSATRLDPPKGIRPTRVYPHLYQMPNKVLFRTLRTCHYFKEIIEDNRKALRFVVGIAVIGGKTETEAVLFINFELCRNKQPMVPCLGSSPALNAAGKGELDKVEMVDVKIGPKRDAWFDADRCMDKLLRYFDRYRIKCAKLVCPMLPRMQELFQVVDPVEVIIQNADAEVVNIPWKEAKRLASFFEMGQLIQRKIELSLYHNYDTFPFDRLPSCDTLYLYLLPTFFKEEDEEEVQAARARFDNVTQCTFYIGTHYKYRGGRASLVLKPIRGSSDLICIMYVEYEKMKPAITAVKIATWEDMEEFEGNVRLNILAERPGLKDLRDYVNGAYRNTRGQFHFMGAIIWRQLKTISWFRRRRAVVAE